MGIAPLCSRGALRLGLSGRNSHRLSTCVRSVWIVISCSMASVRRGLAPDDGVIVLRSAGHAVSVRRSSARVNLSPHSARVSSSRVSSSSTSLRLCLPACMQQFLYRREVNRRTASPRRGMRLHVQQCKYTISCNCLV